MRLAKFGRTCSSKCNKSVIWIVKIREKAIKQNRRLDCDLPFNEFFKILKEKHKIDLENVRSVKVMVAEKKERDNFKVDKHEKLKTVFEIDPIKFINFMVFCEKVKISPPTPVKSTFEILMDKKTPASNAR